MRPDRGKVVALGREYWRLPCKEQDLFRLRYFGHVPQKLDLIPALTARGLSENPFVLSASGSGHNLLPQPEQDSKEMRHFTGIM